MSAHGDKYVLDAGKSGHARLRAISEIHDDRTRALLLEAGLEAGDRYVEFGCGLGYVTRWATSVGAEALGIDLSADQIAEATALAEGKTSSASEVCTTTACLREASTCRTRAGCSCT